MGLREHREKAQRAEIGVGSRAGLTTRWPDRIYKPYTNYKESERTTNSSLGMKKRLGRVKGKEPFTKADCENIWGKASSRFSPPKSSRVLEGRARTTAARWGGQREQAEQRGTVQRGKVTGKQLLQEVKLGKHGFC